jgi:hypothetical protein
LRRVVQSAVTKADVQKVGNADARRSTLHIRKFLLTLAKLIAFAKHDAIYSG